MEITTTNRARRRGPGGQLSNGPTMGSNDHDDALVCAHRRREIDALFEVRIVTALVRWNRVERQYNIGRPIEVPGEIFGDHFGARVQRDVDAFGGIADSQRRIDYLYVQILDESAISRDVPGFDLGVVIRAHTKHRTAHKRHVREEMEDCYEDKQAVISLEFHPTWNPDDPDDVELPVGKYHD